MKFNFSTCGHITGKALLILAITCFFQVNQANSQVSWSNIGPGGGGWLSSITVVDDEDHTIYVACDVGGVYKSTDNGNSWEIKNSGLAIYYIHDIAFDPQTRTTLYAASRGGVYKSTDGGDNWVLKRNGFPEESEYTFSAPVSDILVDPVHPETVYAGIGVPRAGYELESYHWETAGIKGAVYKSENSGESWTLFRNTGIDTTAMVYSLAMDPANNSVLYAATSSGIYKSITAGETWFSVNSGLPNLLAVNLVIDPNDSQRIYVTLWAEPGSPQWFGGVYFSDDGGGYWNEKNTGLPQEMGPERGLTCNYPSIVMDSSDPMTLYVGNNAWTPQPGVFKTTNGGDNWTRVSIPEPPGQNMDMAWITEHGPFTMCMATDPQDSNRVFFGTSTHLFKTENGGGYWGQAFTTDMGDGTWRGNGLETTVAQIVAVDPSAPDDIYVGYWDVGLLKSTDGGVSFKKATSGMHYASNTFDIIVDPVADGVVYAASGWWETNEGEVYVSTTHGESWTALNNGLPDAQVWSIALDITSDVNARTLYATSYDHGVYRTTDGGSQWVSVSSGLGVDGNLQARKVYIDPNNPRVIYAGFEARETESGDVSQTTQGGLFRSRNSGASWVRLDGLTPQINVWDIVVAPGDSLIVYTAVSGQYDHSLGETFYGGVYKSTDGGLNWTNSSNGFGPMDNLNVVALAMSPADNNILYAVTTDDPFHDRSSGRGIFKTIDGGASWFPINDGLGVLYFEGITIDPTDASVLYAGSSGNGLLKGIDLDLTGYTQSEIPAGKTLLIQNTPNPFNPETHIRFFLPSQQDVSLKVFDLEGRLVRTLLNENLVAGSHNAFWDGRDNKGSGVASGVYFYQLKSRQVSLSRKMTLLK